MRFLAGPSGRVAFYFLVAVALTWPAALHPVSAVPGADRTDLWDSLWSLWFVWERLSTGTSPLTVDGLLNHPDGGAFWVADPVNALLALPLLPIVGPATAWSFLVIAHLTFTGVVAHRLGEAVAPGAGLVTGVAVGSSPILLAHVHNGASEAVGQGWLVLAILRLYLLRTEPTARNTVLAGLAVGWCAIGHWYGGVVAGIFLVAFLPAAPRRFLLAAGLAALLAAPVAAIARHQSKAPGNVVAIKDARELAVVRRTIGPADPVGFYAPGEFRSPDFSRLSRYGEQYVHCNYLGFVVTAGALWGLRKGGRKGAAPWIVASLVSAALACGPVLVDNGGPLILPGRRAVPLPYFLIEKIPPFSDLSLLYRLAFGAVIGLATLAGRSPAGTRWAPWIAVLLLAETRLVSPARDLPDHVDATADPTLALIEGPGGVMNFPVVAGRPYLYEQTLHGQPVAATLNFPDSAAARKVWTTMVLNVAKPCADFLNAAEQRSRKEGIRWLVLHADAVAEPDEHDPPARRMAECREVDFGAARTVIDLWER